MSLHHHAPAVQLHVRKVVVVVQPANAVGRQLPTRRQLTALQLHPQTELEFSIIPPPKLTASPKFASIGCADDQRTKVVFRPPSIYLLIEEKGDVQCVGDGFHEVHAADLNQFEAEVQVANPQGLKQN